MLWENDNGAPGSVSSSITPTPGGTGYIPTTLDSHNDGYADILWYRPGAASESYWNFTPTGNSRGTCCNVGGTYKNAAGDLFGDGHDDILWMNDTASSIWDWHLNSNGGVVRQIYSLPTAAAAAALQATVTASNRVDSTTGRAASENERVVIELTETDAIVETNQGAGAGPIS